MRWLREALYRWRVRRTVARLLAIEAHRQARHGDCRRGLTASRGRGL
jgi:hypothetical protein